MIRKRLSHRIAGLLAAMGIAASLGTTLAAETAGTTPKRDLENTLYMDLKDGRVVIEMRPDIAPKHVARIKELTRKGFYNGVAFHRVMEGFMAQTGDPTGTGRGGSGQKLDPEFSDLPHVRGTVSMARGAALDSADSQWFIMLGDAPHLNGQYTVWGNVVEGMDKVDKIRKSDDPVTGVVKSPDKIVKLQVASDAEKAHAAATTPPAATTPGAAATGAPAVATPAKLVTPAPTMPALPGEPTVKLPALPNAPVTPSAAAPSTTAPLSTTPSTTAPSTAMPANPASKSAPPATPGMPVKPLSEVPGKAQDIKPVTSVAPVANPAVSGMAPTVAATANSAASQPVADPAVNSATLPAATTPGAVHVATAVPSAEASQKKLLQSQMDDIDKPVKKKAVDITGTPETNSSPTTSGNVQTGTTSREATNPAVTGEVPGLPNEQDNPPPSP